MPLMPGLLRRRGPTSDVDIRRHSFLSPEAAAPTTVVKDGRASEQIPRRPSAAEFLSPEITGSSAVSPSRASAESNGPSLQRSVSPPVQEETQKHRRFSMLKFRHASDSQLSIRARQQAQAQAQAEPVPPMPHPPEIIMTAPTVDMNATKPTKKKSRVKMPGRVKSSVDTTADEPVKVTKEQKKERRKTMSESLPSGSKSRVTFDEPIRPPTSTAGIGSSPPAYGDDSTSTLALPLNRLSESSRSDGSSGDHGVYATTTTTHTVHTTTTFFRLPRRKKTPSPLFDLSHLPQKSSFPDHRQHLEAPRASASSSRLPAGTESAAVKAVRSGSTENILPSPIPSPSHSYKDLAKSTSAFAATGAPALFRHGSTASSVSSPTRSRLGQRGRSSTLSSLRNAPSDEALPTPTIPASVRTSTSTGRKSFGDLFNLSHRLRQNSEPPFPRNSGLATPGSNTSKNNSMQLAREEPIVLPERQEDDTPAKYLVRLEEAVSRGVVASVLSKGTDQFSQAVLRSYMRGFGFFGDPMDMAIRKLLMEVELPKETQQIDRCLQSFANRYHECNPGIYANPDQAYFIAFSLLILHTDVFNKNNKHKMQKPDYLKNTRGEGIFDEILECFYDNISYTPFIHVEDDLDINGERIIPHKMKKKSKFPRGNADPSKRPLKEPVDPYTLIIDSNLDSLRPNLKEVMFLEEHYNYLGTAQSLNLPDLQKTFFRTGVLQIVSARSRPDAFMSEKTVTNPEEAQAGIVDIKITKVGLLWRKDAKKKKTRSPWQEWGAILTGAQLYFFRNTAWIKTLIHQLEHHIKQGHDGIPVTFKPPLEQFKPDALMSTDNAVALLDFNYKKHKNAFVFIRHGGFEETFLADNEQEMNDWLAKLNYAAAFRTAGVRMRGVVGGNYEGQRTRGIRRLGTQTDATRHQTPTGEVTVVSGKIDTKMAQDILAARRGIMRQKIEEAEEKLAVAQKHLETQLRNARHLQILAPIQQRTREHVILAAGRMEAQLKWCRMEIWRLKCHSDILTLDLEEEKDAVETTVPQSEIETPVSDRNATAKLRHRSSTVQRVPASPNPNRSTSSSHQGSQPDDGHGLDDIFQTPSGLTTSSSFHKQQASWELPPLSFDAPIIRRTSVSSAVPPSPTSLATTPSRASLKPAPASAGEGRAPSPNVDAAEQAILAQAGLAETEKTPERRKSIAPEVEDVKEHASEKENEKEKEKEKDKGKEKEKEKEKSDRGKIRRSLHRTLREGRENHMPHHTRSRKGKDSASSAAITDEVKEDVLSRGTGSFVVHGKKASVITFGSELQSMSPEERLRLRRASHKEEQPGVSPASIEDDFQSILAEPTEFHERHGSFATTSTSTAKSISDLRQRLHPSNVPAIVTSDGEDSEAISFSEGRRTPLPPVEDEDENGLLSSRPGSQHQQAMFFTPEASNSPSKESFAHGTSIEHNEEGDMERLATSPPQTAISA